MNAAREGCETTKTVNRIRENKMMKHRNKRQSERKVDGKIIHIRKLDTMLKYQTEKRSRKHGKHLKRKYKLISSTETKIVLLHFKTVETTENLHNGIILTYEEKI